VDNLASAEGVKKSVVGYQRGVRWSPGLKKIVQRIMETIVHFIVKA